MHRNAASIGRETLILALHYQGATRMDIAAQVGLSYARVSQVLAANGCLSTPSPARLIHLRDVWAAVTRQPHASPLAIARACRCSRSTVQSCLRDLAQRGYLRTDPDKGNARVVLLPLYEGSR